MCVTDSGLARIEAVVAFSTFTCSVVGSFLSLPPVCRIGPWEIGCGVVRFVFLDVHGFGVMVVVVRTRWGESCVLVAVSGDVGVVVRVDGRVAVRSVVPSFVSVMGPACAWTGVAGFADAPGRVGIVR